MGGQTRTRSGLSKAVAASVAVAGLGAALVVAAAGPAAAQGLTVGGSGATYYLNDSFSGSANTVVSYGEPGDEVYVGDWDGNGTDTLMVRRGNTFFARNSATSGAADVTFGYGNPGDTVLVGDWDGNGTDTLTVRRGNSYFVKNSVTTGVADVVFYYGDPGDSVLVGDWDGVGGDTLMVRRASTYYVKNDLSTGVASNVFVYGDPGDVVLAGRWSAGQPGDTLGVRRGNTYFLRNSLTSGPADTVFGYGEPTDTAFTGDWNGDGVDTLGVRRGVTGNQLSFGQTWFGPGFEYTMGPLSSYTPSKSAYPSNVQRAVRTTVTIRNTSNTALSPSDFYETATINGAEADEVYDSANGINGAPYTDILPGRTVTYAMVLAIPSPGELIVQAHFDYRNSVFYIAYV
jgi:hypothetical protein